MDGATLLRSARTAAGLSQRDLARRTGVAQPLVSAIENGRRQPGADLLLRLLRATGHDLQLRDTVAASRAAAAKLEQVAGMAMALPSRDPGPLTYPTWASLRA